MSTRRLCLTSVITTLYLRQNNIKNKVFGNKTIPTIPAPNSLLFLPSYYASDVQERKHNDRIDSFFDKHFSGHIESNDMIILDTIINSTENLFDKKDESQNQSHLELLQAVNDIQIPNEK